MLAVRTLAWEWNPGHAGRDELDWIIVGVLFCVVGPIVGAVIYDRGVKRGSTIVHRTETGADELFPKPTKPVKYPRKTQ